jgi:hypothetical protein
LLLYNCSSDIAGCCYTTAALMKLVVAIQLQLRYSWLLLYNCSSDEAGCCYTTAALIQLVVAIQLQLHLTAVVECRSQSHFLEQTTKQHSYRT